jgi:S1-C subfamily serine protease
MVTESTEQRQQRLREQIRSISIRILANGESIGSGVLIDKQDRAYTVVTNAHVIQAASAPFKIQTHDGQVYIAALIPPPAKQNRDLSILRFQSDRNYIPTKLATVSPKIGTLVWAAGFPFDDTTTPANSQNVPARVSGLTIADGKVTQILPVAITGGYQIGADNAVRKGMSGGPLVDGEGNLVGINGIHANPLWDVAETLEDGTKVTAKLQEQIDSYSWAIPIDFVENYSSQ